MLQRRRARGFTLLELSAVLAIMAIVAGLSVGGYGLHVRSARTQEAVLNVHALADLLRARPGPPVACAPSPAAVPRGAAAPWAPSPGFEALGWRPAATTRYQYEVIVPGPEGAAFEVRARGDLDGDGEPSLYRLRADRHTLEITGATE